MRDPPGRAKGSRTVQRRVLSAQEVKVGRPSKLLTLAQPEAVLRSSEGTRMHAYIVLSLLPGADRGVPGASIG
jgi:hypothetical protein